MMQGGHYTKKRNSYVILDEDNNIVERTRLKMYANIRKGELEQEYKNQRKKFRVLKREQYEQMMSLKNR